MKKSIEIAAHVFFWIVFTLFAFMLSKIYLQADPNAPFAQHLYYVVFFELVMGLVFFYTTFWGIAWAGRRKSRILILAAVLMGLLLLFAYPSTRFGIWEVMSSILPHSIVIFLAGIFRKFSDSIKLEKEKQELLLQNTKSELALLKMQVSPHFLFNTLNNIDYLISADPAKASGCVSKLGDMLRYMIYDAEAEKIPLNKEISHIGDYIELARLRTSGTNYLNFRVTGTPGRLQIAPMLFLPVIENSYKHAATRDGENVINIDIIIDGQEVKFKADNEYDPSSEVAGTGPGGLGLSIVKRRLELIYPSTHTYEVTKHEKRYSVELTIQLDEY